MKNKLSKLSILVLLLFFVLFRLQYGKINVRNVYNVTTWDAFGYYMYLPSVFIYKDVTELKWVSKIDSTYELSGGVFYQAIPQESGQYTNKYLCGVSIMQAPFFFIGHGLAAVTANKQDGFSWPYQCSLIFGAIVWAMLGFIMLSKVLRRYFDDRTTAISLLLIGLCSNIIQYIAIDSAQSHVWIFTLYCFVLWLTIKWHEQAKVHWAILIGLLCGLAVISRPTEIIILFIPLLWQLNSRESSEQKWSLVMQHKIQVVFCIIAGMAGILPQLLYWKYTTGAWIYDVGSKWYFLNPWFRVLFGPEKGWFLYTPVALLMVLGLGFMKKYPFQKSVLTFCLLNLWIIMAWSDWRYGGSYSTRALVQSYPVFALALASLINVILKRKKGLFLFAFAFLFMVLNFYQLHLYNNGTGESFSPILKLINL